MSRPDPIRVFVFLPAGQNAADWHRKWRDGALIGINDPTPYGYGRASDMGCDLTFSSGPAPGVLQRALRKALGFDLIHALRNLRDMQRAEIVWTHTECGWLGAALCLALMGSRRPRIIGQSVWLYDRWSQLSLWRKKLYQHLARRVDVLTMLSPEDWVIARQAFPDLDCRWMHFGIPSEINPPRQGRQTDHILALGNDRHRDWHTAIAAMRALPDLHLTILSTTAPADLADGVDNVTITSVQTQPELEHYLSTAALMLLPLKPNRHASGNTAMQEAALYHLPMIASDTGGLQAYFDQDAVTYVPCGDADALGGAIRQLAQDSERQYAQVQAAHHRIKSEQMGCQAYIARHVALSHEVLRQADRATVPVREAIGLGEQAGLDESSAPQS